MRFARIEAGHVDLARRAGQIFAIDLAACFAALRRSSVVGLFQVEQQNNGNQQNRIDWMQTSLHV